MKILRTQAGIIIRGRAAVEARHRERAVVHDIVEINADAEAVRGFDGLLQLRLRSPVRGGRARLVHITQVIRIKLIVADGKDAAALGGRRQPDRIVTRLGDLRHLLDEIGPGDVEQLEHGLAARRDRAGQRKNHQRGSDGKS